ncbi:MAG: beta-lactamase family protein [Bacteroidetes bacterium]|nr:beta-lactamase family protein [Bacteroidota bacterium]
MTIHKLLPFFLLFVFNSFLFSQNGGSSFEESSPSMVGFIEERLNLLDSHIQQYIDNKTMPGGVFLVARRGKIVYFKSAGKQSIYGERAYQKDDIFRLASMTKAVTTVSILQLFEQGKLGLDDPLFYYIPAFAKSVVLEEFNEADSSFTSTPTKQPITIRHLLTHTSGITYGVFNPGKIMAIYEKLGSNGFGLFHKEMSTEEMVNQIAKVPLVFQPGEKFMYGLNMEILGRVVEIVSGKPLNQYFQDHIFDPLGMHDTWFNLPKEKHNRLVPLYTYDEERQLTMAEKDGPMNPSYPTFNDNNHYAGGGGLSGSTLDYAIFIQTLLNGGIYKGKRILSRKSIEVMTADQLIPLNKKGTGYSKIPGLTFGLGFSVITEEGQSVSHKSPGTFEWGGLFNTKFFIDPAEELIFVGMTQILPFTRPDFWDRMYAIIYGAIED